MDKVALKNWMLSQNADALDICLETIVKGLKGECWCTKEDVTCALLKYTSFVNSHKDFIEI